MTAQSVNSDARREVAVLEARFEACRQRADERWDEVRQAVADLSNRLDDLGEEVKTMGRVNLSTWTQVFLAGLMLAGSLITALLMKLLG